MILYILERIGARPNIGEAVVCKLMYFIDFDFYEKFEEQLIGAKYIKNHFGPTLVAFPEIVAQMEKDGDLTRVIKKYFQHDQKKISATKICRPFYFFSPRKRKDNGFFEYVLAGDGSYRLLFLCGCYNWF